MPEFIRLPNLIVNLSQIREIHFEPDTVIIHWVGGKTRVLKGPSAALFLETLERRYGLWTDPAARFWESEELEELAA